MRQWLAALLAAALTLAGGRATVWAAGAGNIPGPSGSSASVLSSWTISNPAMGVANPDYAYSAASTACGPGQAMQNGTCVATTNTGSCPAGDIPSPTGGCINPHPCGAGAVLANVGGVIAECLTGTQCPPGETNVFNTCQGTGGGSGPHPQWTFACVNGTQVEYVHNPYTGAILNTLTLGSCAPTPAAGPSSAAPPVPGCTPTASTTCGAPVLTGCAGSCTAAGCTDAGQATGSQVCTVTRTCPASSTAYSQSVTLATPACQPALRCAPGQAGYAQWCLTSPAGGGPVHCSPPFYDPHDCPVPVPVD